MNRSIEKIIPKEFDMKKIIEDKLNDRNQLKLNNTEKRMNE